MEMQLSTALSISNSKDMSTGKIFPVPRVLLDQLLVFSKRTRAPATVCAFGGMGRIWREQQQSCL
jgi:hypothetical protein